VDPTCTTLRNCLWGRMIDGNYGSTNFTNAGGNVPNADPKFARGANGLDEYAIQQDSPARDAGITRPWQSTAKDFAGQVRIIGSAVDIGCYEYRDLPRGFAIYIH